MPESKLDAAERAYQKEGFETLRKGDGSLLMAKEAPTVKIVGRTVTKNAATGRFVKKDRRQ